MLTVAHVYRGCSTVTGGRPVRQCLLRQVNGVNAGHDVFIGFVCVRLYTVLFKFEL